MYTSKILVSKHMPTAVGKEQDRFVIFVFMHNHRGAVGALLNGKVVTKISSVHLKDVFNTPEGKFEATKQMIIEKRFSNFPLYFGGPSKTEGIYFVHGHNEFKHINGKDDSPSDMVTGNNEIVDGVFFGSPFTFAHIYEAGLSGENRFKFLTGQFKWHPGQLETEVAAGFWDVIDADAELFYDIEKCEDLLPKAGEQILSRFSVN